MEQVKELNALLQQLQEETPNTGGFYHFTKIELAPGENILLRLQEYHQQFDHYNNPYIFIEREDREVYINERDYKNLSLERIEDPAKWIGEKLQYWSEHRTSLDGRDAITEAYPALEKNFRSLLNNFLETAQLKGAYELKGIDTFYSFGHDHVNDDTLFETGLGVYVLHFGWSS